MNRHLRPAVTPDWLYRVPKLSGTSDSTAANAVDQPTLASGVGSDGRTFPRDLAERGADAGVDSSARSIPASIFEIATAVGRETAKERAGL